MFSSAADDVTRRLLSAKLKGMRVLVSQALELGPQYWNDIGEKKIALLVAKLMKEV